MFKGVTMYRVEIDISAWGGDEKVTIETCDFEKVQIIQEFIDMQIDHGWAVEYDIINGYEDDEEEDDIDEPSTVSTAAVITESQD
jgi:hypothetical protein